MKRVGEKGEAYEGSSGDSERNTDDRLNHVDPSSENLIRETGIVTTENNPRTALTWGISTQIGLTTTTRNDDMQISQQSYCNNIDEDMNQSIGAPKFPQLRTPYNKQIEQLFQINLTNQKQNRENINNSLSPSAHSSKASQAQKDQLKEITKETKEQRSKQKSVDENNNNDHIETHNRKVLRKREKYFTQVIQKIKQPDVSPISHIDPEEHLYARTFNEILLLQKNIDSLGEVALIAKPSIINLGFIKQLEEKQREQQQRDEAEIIDDPKDDLSPIKKIRRRVLQFLLSPLYRTVMILLCIMNIIAFALHDYSGRLDSNMDNEVQNSIASGLELASEIIFLIEILLELFARRFFLGKHAFFKNPWLVCNLISICCSGIALFDGIPSGIYIVIKVISMLRPIRIIQMITPLKIQFERLLRSLPKINLSIWRLIIFMVFYSIVGLHLFSGALEHRCRVSPEPPTNPNENWEIYEDIPFLCGEWDCPEKSPDEYNLTFNSTETDILNLNYGYTNFDNFWSALFTTFHIIRIISWGRTTFMYWRETNTALVTTYFLSLVLICSYVLSNIILAEFYESFEEQSSIKSYAEYKQHKALKKQVSHKVNFKDIEIEYSKQKRGEGIHNPHQPEYMIRDETPKNMSAVGSELISREEQARIMKKNVGFESNNTHHNKNHNSHEQIKEGIATTPNRTLEKIQTLEIPSPARRSSNHSILKKPSHKIPMMNFTIQLPNSQMNPHHRLGIQSKTRQRIIEAFFVLMKLCILLDIIVICSDIAQLSNSTKRILILIDWILLWVSLIEITARIYLEKQEYFKSILNIIDCIILLTRLVVSNISAFYGDNPMFEETFEWIHTVKAIHVFRIFQLVFTTQKLKSVKVLIEFFFRTLAELMYYILIIGFYCALFALIGHTLFANKAEFISDDRIPSDLRIGKPPRVNFDTFLGSLEAVIYCVLNENWNEQMYDFMRSIGDYVSAFWIIIISSGEIFVLKLLMALFINTFLKHFNGREKTEKEEQEEFELDQLVRKQLQEKESHIHHKSSTNSHHEHHHHQQQEEEGHHNNANSNHHLNPISEDTHALPHQKESKLYTILMKIKEWCLLIEHSQKFENFIMCVIITNIIVMAIDSPLLDDHGTVKTAIHKLELGFTAIYGVEILVKMIACGLFRQKGYFREPKNLIDFCLFGLNIVGFLVTQNLGFLNALRAFHIVVLSKHFESLQIILISLYKSLPYLMKLLFFSFCFMLAFAVIPLRMLKEQMNHCVTVEESEAVLIFTKQDCFDLGGDWVRKDFHYDNIFFSLLNLFIVASCEGWSYFSNGAQDSVGSSHQPVTGQNPVWSIFFIVYYFISNIMVFNAFTGVMVQKFNEINDKFLSNQEIIPIKDKKILLGKSTFKFNENLSTQDQEWISIKRSVYHTKPITTFEEPNQDVRPIGYFLHQLTSHRYFIRFSVFCTLLSALIFSMHFHRSSKSYEKSLNIINDILVLVYLIEILLRFIVQKTQYFKNKQNIFELVILVCSMVPSIYRLSSETHQVSYVFRVLQVFRVLRLVNSIPLIESIFSMMRFILPQVAPLAAVYFFTIYIYALFGMHLFAFIKPQDTLNNYDLHFKTFTSSVFTLIRISSGEQWFYIIADIVRNQQPNFVCVQISTHEQYLEHGLIGCGSYWGYLYFFTFHLIVSVVILNLLVAVLLGLIKTQNTAISKYQLSQIKDLWITYDRKGYGFIDYKNFWQFTSRIAMIYGVKKDDLLDPNQKKNFLKFLSLPIYIQKQDHLNIFGFRFHDVVVKMTQISLFLKYGILPGGKDESKQTLRQFYKELDASTKFKGEESYLLSGDIAVIILFQRKIKKWIYRGKELHEAKQKSANIYEKTLQEHHKEAMQINVSFKKDKSSGINNQTQSIKVQANNDIINNNNMQNIKNEKQILNPLSENNSEICLSEDFNDDVNENNNNSSEIPSNIPNKIKNFDHRLTSLADFVNTFQLQNPKKIMK